MTTHLGIAGMPDYIRDLPGLCLRLGVSPVLFLRATAAEAPTDMPYRLVESDDPAAWADAAKDASLTGVIAASWPQAACADSIARRLDLPRMESLADTDLPQLPIPGATYHMPRADVELEPSLRAELPIAAWVRPVRAAGDGSCMRLDHPHDLSLAFAKIRRRSPWGPVRIQPVADGQAYRVLAFRCGDNIEMAAITIEETTTSVYRVPLARVVPSERDTAVRALVQPLVDELSALIPHGWGYLELEVVESSAGLTLVDVQAPAWPEAQMRPLVLSALGVDLALAALTCALGRVPDLTPARRVSTALTWLLTRSGVVTGFQGVEEARALPGVLEVRINAVEGDILTHVVDLPSRNRGGYIVAEGENETIARARLEAAREMVWINTSPALA